MSGFELIAIVLTLLILALQITNSILYQYKLKKSRKRNLIEEALESSIIAVEKAISMYINAIEDFQVSIFKGIESIVKSLINTITSSVMIITEVLDLIISNLIDIIVRIIYLVLLISFLWTSYFLYLGVRYPDTAEYSANIATLIVSVATIFSVLVAFHEFRNKSSKKITH